MEYVHVWTIILTLDFNQYAVSQQNKNHYLMNQAFYIASTIQVNLSSSIAEH